MIHINSIVFRQNLKLSFFNQDFSNFPLFNVGYGDQIYGKIKSLEDEVE
jgi:hypothetical protein